MTVRGAARLAAAGGSGLALLLAFPPYDAWWLAPVAVALLALAVHRCRVRTGAGLGAVTGLVLFVPLLSWTNTDIGYLPWLLLATLQAAFLVLLGAAGAYLSPVADRWRWTWPLLIAAAWVGQEALRSRVPFGGFPWGRLAFSQGEAPTLPLAALGGAPLVTFAVALAGGLLAAALAAAYRRRWRAAPLLAGAGLLLLAGPVVPLPAPEGPPVTVAIVQGNVPRLGLDFNTQRAAVLGNHVDATLGLARDVAAGRTPRPDLVVWPENSTDIDPLADARAAGRIQEAADAIGAPILVGTSTRDPDGEARNIGLMWHPGPGAGPGERYAKRHPVPFAEYLPLRPVTEPIARAITDEADRIAGFVGGDEPGVLAAGPATIGDVICFEVAYDGLVRETVTGGAQLLVVQTNNATFNEAEARQQLAMVRLRAVEHGRYGLMASTVGVSGFTTPDGEVLDQTGFFTRDVPVRTLRLSDHRTLATVLGFWPELLFAGAAAAALGVAFGLRRRDGRARGGTTGQDGTTDGDTADEGGRMTTADGERDGEPLAAGQRVLVVIPTYNEVENLTGITDRVRDAVPEAEILVVDDGSPDGTGELADRLAAADPRRHVLHRSGKQGLGVAYLAGFAWARERGFDVVVEMDADGSHPPEQLPRLLTALAEADVVLGSRWVPGGTIVNWPWRRLLLSRLGNTYVRLMLRMPVRDATGGFRAYRMPVLDKIDDGTVASQGYCFQVDLVWRAHRHGLRVVEVPITFVERERGASKMSPAIVREALWRVTIWGVRARGAALARAVRRG